MDELIYNRVTNVVYVTTGNKKQQLNMSFGFTKRSPQVILNALRDLSKERFGITSGRLGVLERDEAKDSFVNI